MPPSACHRERPTSKARHRFRRHGFAAVASLGVVVALTTSTTATASTPGSPGQPDWLPNVRDSRALAGPAAAHGTVRTPDGGGPATGADVYLQAWPNADTLGAVARR